MKVEDTIQNQSSVEGKDEEVQAKMSELPSVRTNELFRSQLQFSLMGVDDTIDRDTATAN